MNAYLEEKNNKWIVGSGGERRMFQQERDNRIIELVNTYEVVTCELVCALLQMDYTTSNMNIVERRMRLLAKEKNFTQVRQENVTYTVALSVSLRKHGARAQLLHRHMQSKFWATLLHAIPIDERKTDREFRAQGGIIIPDGYFVTKGHSFFVECNTGRDSFDSVLKKAREYYRQKDYLNTIYDIPSFRVLWVSRSPERATTMLRRFAEVNGGGLFLVASEEDIDLFDTGTILNCWRSPKTGEQQPLIEEMAM